MSTDIMINNKMLKTIRMKGYKNNTNKFILLFSLNAIFIQYPMVTYKISKVIMVNIDFVFIIGIFLSMVLRLLLCYYYMRYIYIYYTILCTKNLE